MRCLVTHQLLAPLIGHADTAWSLRAWQSLKGFSSTSARFVFELFEELDNSCMGFPRFGVWPTPLMTCCWLLPVLTEQFVFGRTEPLFMTCLYFFNYIAAFSRGFCWRSWTGRTETQFLVFDRWEVSTGLPVMILPRNHANWVDPACLTGLVTDSRRRPFWNCYNAITMTVFWIWFLTLLSTVNATCNRCI